MTSRCVQRLDLMIDVFIDERYLLLHLAEQTHVGSFAEIENEIRHRSQVICVMLHQLRYCLHHTSE